MTHGTKLNILVVTGNADTPWYAGAGLTLRGFAVRRTSDAASALRSAAAFRADAVVLDFATDGLDGAALARDLRGLRCGGHAPVLLVAVNAEESAGRSGVDLSLRGDVVGVAGVLVGVMTRFRALLIGLRGDPCASHRTATVTPSSQATIDIAEPELVFAHPRATRLAHRNQHGSLMHKQHPNRTDSLKIGSPVATANARNIHAEFPDRAAEVVPADAIRARAFQMWEQAGKPSGDGATFWLDAERELADG